MRDLEACKRSATIKINKQADLKNNQSEYLDL